MGTTALMKLYSETKSIMNRLEETPYEQLVQLVDMRELALAELQASTIVEDTDKGIVRELMACDEALKGRMQQLCRKASESLCKINFSKIQKRVYEQDFIESSFFFDKKK